MTSGTAVAANHSTWGVVVETLQRAAPGDSYHRYGTCNKNSSGDEIANVNFFYNIAHVEASAYAH